MVTFPICLTYEIDTVEIGDLYTLGTSRGKYKFFGASFALRFTLLSS
jgi:hypothetical protein